MEKITDDGAFLFADPTFVGGAATALDIGGSLVVYNVSRDGNEADLRSLASDWAVTGRDLKCGIEKFKKEAEAKR